MRILIAEYHTYTSNTLKEILNCTCNPIDITTSPSGESALEQIMTSYEEGEQPFDILITADELLPGEMTGIELARSVKKINCRIQVIMTTTKTYQKQPDFVDYIKTKPVNPYELMNLIKGMKSLKAKQTA